MYVFAMYFSIKRSRWVVAVLFNVYMLLYVHIQES